MTGEERALWERLEAEAPIPDVMASAVGLPIVTGSPRIVVARRAGAPVAVAALAEEASRWQRLFARRLVAAGDPHWTCRYPICGHDVEADARALLEELAARGGWDDLVLGPMLAGTRVFHALLAAGRALGMRPLVTETGRSARVVFAGAWDDYWKGRSANLRALVARGAKKLAPVALDQVRGGPELDGALATFFALEATGWKLAEGSAIACDPDLRDRYVRLAHAAAARGQLRMFLLRSADHVVAASYCLEHEGEVFLMKTAYDPAAAKASPGYVLHHRMLEALWPQCEAFDFMPGGGEHGGYKQRFANALRSYAQLELFRPRRPRGQLLAGLVRLKRALDAHREASP